ncbi:MAG: glutathione S-transferase family protein [Hyphomicrobiales bacterium]|nr:glutathione S-transferase family protein [Hyphomicrobiales bacterium]
MHLIIGNKMYSSWSLRPWLLMKVLGIPFAETVIPLDQPDSKRNLLEHSPSGKVPLLIDDSVRVWESIAIIEYLAEKFPSAGVWPKDQKMRAHARAVSSEMHSGFAALRQACPMNLGRKFKSKPLSADVMRDVARIETIFQEARSKFGASGPFLYGSFSAADAMFAPVITRFDTYQVGVGDVTKAYMATILGLSQYREWRLAALKEPWHLPDYEAGWDIAESYITQRN